MRFMSHVTADPELSKARRLRAFSVLALAAALALVRIALPVGVGLFLGALLAFTLQPLYGRMRARKWGPSVSALVCSLGTAVVVTAAVTGLGALLINRGAALIGALTAAMSPDGGLRVLVERNIGRVSAVGLDPQAVSSQLQEQVLSLGGRAANVAATLAGATLSTLLTLFFMTLAMYYVLRRWNDLVQQAEVLLPFERRHTEALLDQFRKVGRQVLLGTVTAGFVQGALAAIGYRITGVPDPAFFGILTGIASLVPAVGTLLVWLPVAAFLMLTGHVAAGLVSLVYSAVVVVIVTDYVIRPRRVGREQGVPAILTFVSLFGGVEVFGLIGLVLGPVIVTLAVAILRTYQAELEARDGS